VLESFFVWHNCNVILKSSSYNNSCDWKSSPSKKLKVNYILFLSIERNDPLSPTITCFKAFSRTNTHMIACIDTIEHTTQQMFSSGTLAASFAHRSVRCVKCNLEKHCLVWFWLFAYKHEMLYRCYHWKNRLSRQSSKITLQTTHISQSTNTSNQ